MKHQHKHDHSHDKNDHHHHHHHTPANFNFAFAIAVILNLAFTLIETGYGLYAHSMGLLADAAHNFGDVLSLLMTWAANILLMRAATEKYSYGYKKTTILSALANALILVFISGIILYESFNKLFHPVSVHEMIIIVVALIGIAINGSTALLFLKGSEEDINIKSAFLHLAYDALISVGVVLAGVIILFTNWLWLDPLAGIIIVLVILLGTSGLLRDSVNLILGAVPRGVNQQGVRNYLSQLPGVVAIHDLHIWGLSTRENALTAHLIMPDKHFTDEDYQEINHILAHDFKIQHVTLQIEKGNSENPCGQAVTC